MNSHVKGLVIQIFFMIFFVYLDTGIFTNFLHYNLHKRKDFAWPALLNPIFP